MLPFQQFQVLFNSLFKVLFIFPSRYLFAIGLPPIFSFRWNLPPTLSCNPKQLDSLNTIKSFRQERESHPLCCLFPKDLAQNSFTLYCFYIPQLGTGCTCTDSHGEHFPLQSPLLRESLLVSFPPLNYMLKFGGYSYKTEIRLENIGLLLLPTLLQEQGQSNNKSSQT